MASFQYKSMTNEGQVQQGMITAVDRAAAVRLLLGRGETATTVEPIDKKLSIRCKGWR